VNPALVLRRELPGDEEPARALHDAAFGIPAGEEHSVETVLLDGLRADGDVLDALTLVAELHGELVGHAVCSRASLGEGTCVALGPIGVRPDHQGQGIGSALVSAVLVTADQRREPCVVLLGDPGWYAHFGFETAATHGIRSPGPWEDRFFQVKRLGAWRPELAGRFRYAPAFDRLPPS
jgi:putative acetyltransferase